MPYKYSPYKAFYYRSWPWLLGLFCAALLILFYLSCCMIEKESPLFIGSILLRYKFWQQQQ